MVYVKKTKLEDFDLFCNPNSKVYDWYETISFNCLNYSSYIHYFGLEHINGEINSSLFIIDSLEEVHDYLLNGYIVYAFNHCDNIVLEVVL